MPQPTRTSPAARSPRGPFGPIVALVLGRWPRPHWRRSRVRRYIVRGDDGRGASFELQVVATRVAAARRAEAAVLAEVERCATPADGALDPAAPSAVDGAAARAAAVDGVVEVLLAFNGSVRHCGGRAVAVDVADPRALGAARPVAAVRLRGEAVVTSGGASVLAPDCATAAALATAFRALPPAECVALADARPGVGCLLVGADGSVTANAHWRARAALPGEAHAAVCADVGRPALSTP